MTNQSDSKNIRNLMFDFCRRFALKLPVIAYIHRWHAELSQQQEALRQRQAVLEQQQTELAHGHAALGQRQAALEQQQTELAHGHAALGQRQAALEQQQTELRQRQVALESNALSSKLPQDSQKPKWHSVDRTPWQHPYLTVTNIQRFREYSEAVWNYALDYVKKHPEPLKIAFTVNMAQNMHKWAYLAQKYGAEVGLFPIVWDGSAINAPEWENFDGEWANIQDGDGFLKAQPNISLEVPCYRIPMTAYDFYAAYQEFQAGNRQPLLQSLAQTPSLRHEVMMDYESYYHYYHWTKAVAKYDVIYGTSIPLNAYFSGRPYCVFSCGGDLQYDCGRGDTYGQVMHLCFNAARFLMVSNPHTLGHCRRLGLTNGVYLPYPMDDSRYYPGPGQARNVWESRYGPGTYVLMTSRLDDQVKGQDTTFFHELVEVARRRSELRFIFLAWGNSVAEFQTRVHASGLQDQFILLSPVGKKRLIDYYRSCDIVLDQFVYGYYGATALEAAAIGKPVVMKLRHEQYAPLYRGDVMPALHAATPVAMGQALLTLVENRNFRLQRGLEIRRWLVRNHGEEKTLPLLLALLRMTADHAPLPEEPVNPLRTEVTEAEQAYHRTCLQEAL
jgi:glycosyltransferase involved in cell wall biosynthesis